MKTFMKTSILTLTVAMLALGISDLCLGQSEFASINPEDGMAGIVVTTDSFYDVHQYLPEDHRSDVILNREPEFFGGNDMIAEYLANNFNYPVSAIENGIQGVMRVAFDIDENGKVHNVRITEGSNKALEKELISTIKAMPNWTPAIRHGFPSECTVELPFKATLL
jgi:TonB family protein